MSYWSQDLDYSPPTSPVISFDSPPASPDPDQNNNDDDYYDDDEEDRAVIVLNDRKRRRDRDLWLSDDDIKRLRKNERYNQRIRYILDRNLTDSKTIIDAILHDMNKNLDITDEDCKNMLLKILEKRLRKERKNISCAKLLIILIRRVKKMLGTEDYDYERKITQRMFEEKYRSEYDFIEYIVQRFLPESNTKKITIALIGQIRQLYGMDESEACDILFSALEANLKDLDDDDAKSSDQATDTIDFRQERRHLLKNIRYYLKYHREL